MDKTINDKHEIAYKSLHSAPALVDLDKKTRCCGIDVPTFHSKIHVIMVIAEHPGIHVGGLADILGVTKGAASEILKKLERKVLVIKEIDDLSLSRYSLNLTEKGKRAHNNHMHHHVVLNSMVEDELKNVSEQELVFLINFLSFLMSRVEFFNEDFDEWNFCISVQLLYTFFNIVMLEDANIKKKKSSEFSMASDNSEMSEWGYREKETEAEEKNVCAVYNSFILCISFPLYLYDCPMPPQVRSLDHKQEKGKADKLFQEKSE